MKSNYILIFFCLMFFACKQDQKKADDSAAPVATTPVVPKTEETFVSLPDDIVRTMVDKVDYIDYLWNDLPFSVSQEEKKAIVTNITFISAEPQTTIPAGCKSIGRKTFNIKGEILIEADVYFSKGCAFYVFIKDNKKVYANKMTPQGIEFYTKLIASASKQK
jgi:hypothetical protein